MTSLPRLLSAIGLALAVTTVLPPLHAETEAQRAHRSHEIMGAVNSPFCPAATLASCGSPQAAEWRREIQQWVDEGLTKNEICARLEARVGHRLCAVPTTAWGSAMPILLSLASIAVLGLLLRRFTRTAPPGAAAAPTTAPASGAAKRALDSDLDRELAELDDERP